MATIDDLTDRLDRLKLAHSDVAEAQAALGLITDESSVDFKEATDRLTEANNTLTAATLSMVTVSVRSPTEPDKLPKIDVSKADPAGLRMDYPAMASTSTRYTAKINQLKEYRYGQNFTIWGKRFRRYLKYTRTPQQDALDMLLSNVDDKTTELLESVEAKMTDSQRSDPDLFIPLLEQAIYPAGEIRGLRAELLGGDLVQKDDETIDDFASRVRSLGNRAYHNADDREEPCLHAFLRGIREESLYNMVIAAPGTDDNFEAAVIEARKFEKLRRRKKQTESTDSACDVFQLSATQHVAPRIADQEPQETYKRPIHESRFNKYNDRSDKTTYSGKQCYRCQLRGHIARLCTAPAPVPLNLTRAGDSGRVRQ